MCVCLYNGTVFAFLNECVNPAELNRKESFEMDMGASVKGGREGGSWGVKSSEIICCFVT